jgi:uroporphyrinogen III methyltransferase/synthase
VTPRRYIVTRPAEHAAVLSEALRAIGIEPVEVPAVSIAPPESWEALDAALLRLAQYDWIVFTSRSGVEILFDRAGPGFAWPGVLRWAAIGLGTASALGQRGITDVWIPPRFLAEAVAEEMPATPGQRVLRVRAERASTAPTDGLRARGVEVEDVIAYRTQEAPASSLAPLRRAWTDGVEGVIFTSASTVRGFLTLLEAAGLRAQAGAVRRIAIGPVTAAALRAEDLHPHAVAAEHSVQGLIDILTGGRDDHVARVHGA